MAVTVTVTFNDGETEGFIAESIRTKEHVTTISGENYATMFPVHSYARLDIIQDEE